MNTKYRRLRSCVSGVLTAAAIGQVAHAAERSAVLEEIVVTAQKRTESLQEVPIAISVFSGETRDLIGIKSIQDFTDFTPGITYSTSLDRMSIRGIGRQTNNLATSASVATYGDGFYNSSNHQADTSTLFTERVEVLRGPQGTLYGRNSIGGTLNVLLKRPKNEWGAETRVAIGNFGRKEIEGVMTGPLTDRINFRLGGGRYQQDDGFVHNVIPGMDDLYGQRDDKYGLFMLDMKIGDSVDVFFKVTHSEWDQGYGTSVNLSPYSTAARPCALDARIGVVINPATGLVYPPTPANPTNTSCRPSLVATGSLGPSVLYNTGPAVGSSSFDLNPANPQYTTPNPGVLDHRAVNQDHPGRDTLIPDNIYVFEMVGHLGFADLKYVGGYHNYEYILKTDFDNANRTSFVYTPPAAAALGCSVATCTGVAGAVTIFGNVQSTYIETKRFYSNELNLISTGESALQWQGGLFQYFEYYEQPVDTYNADQPQLRTPLFGPANPNGTYQLTDAHTTTKSAAAFGQIDWEFIDAWKATLGLRYTKDHKSGTEYIRRVSWNPAFTGSFASAVDITGLTAASGGFNNPLIVGAHASNDGTGRWERDLDKTWSATTGTAGLAWQPFDGANAYFKFSRGYKDGGMNAGALAVTPYTEEETVNAYEMGWKQNIGGNLTANLSVFFYDYKDAQIPLSLVTPFGTNTFIANIDAKTVGAELETVWKPMDEFQVLFNYSNLGTEIDHSDSLGCFSDSLDVVTIGPRPCVGGGQSIDGNEMPGSPHHKAALNGVYTVTFAPGSLAFSGSFVWRSSQYSSIFTRNEFKVPSYSQVDARATWTSADNDYSVIGYVRNALDKEGFDGVGASVGSSGVTRSYSLTPPRQFGVELQYRFGSAK